MIPSKSFHLVSVNKTPARAALLVAQLLDSLSNKYDIMHVANSSTVEGLKLVLEILVHAPSILICSSQWSIEEQRQANAVARNALPNIHIINIPPGLDQREGSEGILDYLQLAIRDVQLPSVDM